MVPFNISCGHCWMCEQQLFAQCETTQNRETGTGASLFGYTKLYGQVPGGQAEYLRVPHADFGPIKVPGNGVPDDRFLFLSDVLPTAWQAVEYAAIPEGGSVAVFGLGPIGQMAARIAKHRGTRPIGIDLVRTGSNSPASGGSRRLTSPTEPGTRPRSPSGCASSPTVVARTRRSTPSEWRLYGAPFGELARTRPATCRTRSPRR